MDARPRSREDLEVAATAVNVAACWDSWDGEEQRWRHWARKGARVGETDEIGVPLRPAVRPPLGNN